MLLRISYNTTDGNSTLYGKKMPKVGGSFVQAESETAAINMVYGAASTGVRVMTSSSSPGISLNKKEYPIFPVLNFLQLL